MTALLRKYPFHPLLFCVYPILALWSANAGMIPGDEIVAPLLVSFLVLVGLAVLLRLLRLGARQIAALLTLWAAVFFSYGHVIFALVGAQAAGRDTISPVTVTLIYGVAWVCGSWAAVRLAGKSEFLHVFLNLAGLALVAMTGGQILLGEVQALLRDDRAFFAAIEQTGADLPEQMPPRRPDIYYIILDGYGSQAALERFLDFDNSAFIRGLEERGFYVAGGAAANYTGTSQSLASSLNMNYITPLAEIMGRESTDYRPIRRLMQNNRVMAILKEYDYQTVAFASGFSITEIKSADHYRSAQPEANTFETLLLNNSLVLLWKQGELAAQYRNRIPAVLNAAAVDDVPSPKFVFAHVMAAHPPYVFGPNGEARGQAVRVEEDPGRPQASALEKQAYRDQVIYVNGLVLAMIDKILARGGDPVIIIQGDHGSAFNVDWESAENSCILDRASILAAYYMPGQKTDLLYDTISPVNAFRVIFNTYLGASFPLLEDRTYFTRSINGSTYFFEDVTGIEGACP